MASNCFNAEQFLYRMRRLILLFVSSFAVLFVSAQKDSTLDSIADKHLEIKEKQPIIERDLGLEMTTVPETFGLFDPFVFNQPLFPDISKKLDFKRSISLLKMAGNLLNPPIFPVNPLFMEGNMFSQSALQLNDRFLIGGGSFGARSIFDQPKLNSSIQDMSIRGASLFMQYKVSDHFKVQTRVSISNSGATPWMP